MLPVDVEITRLRTVAAAHLRLALRANRAAALLSSKFRVVGMGGLSV
jgi:hypothetical protein